MPYKVEFVISRNPGNPKGPQRQFLQNHFQEVCVQNAQGITLRWDLVSSMSTSALSVTH